MAAATLKIFLQQDLATQYADLRSAGVLVKKTDDSYRDKQERYTFLTSTFTVYKESGVVVRIEIDTLKVPALA